MKGSIAASHVASRLVCGLLRRQSLHQQPPDFGNRLTRVQVLRAGLRTVDQSEGGLRGHLAEFGFVEAQDLHKVARLGVLRDYFEETHVPTSLIFGPQVTSPLSTL